MNQFNQTYLIGDFLRVAYLPAMQKIIVQNITKKFGRNLIFSGLNAEFNPGATGIAGSNGSGKSTLMKCLSGLMKPDSGTISHFEGDSVLDRNGLIRHLGFSAPYIQMYSELTCAENLELLSGLRDGAGVMKADEVLELVELHHKRDQPYGNLSSGLQQRLRLAGALIHKPAFLLLDEPGTNLDRNGFALVKRIVEEAKNRNATVILASNDSGELDLCDTIIAVEDFKTEHK